MGYGRKLVENRKPQSKSWQNAFNLSFSLFFRQIYGLFYLDLAKEMCAFHLICRNLRLSQVDIFLPRNAFPHEVNLPAINKWLFPYF
jgi:hypothetical protein